ncbi:MAG: tetratricopeptide repeat protein [Alphaproteobacteria bacterium]|nr:tetratricopeptide repeat protein [Alphaproteobacteria bacterium]
MDPRETLRRRLLDDGLPAPRSTPDTRHDPVLADVIRAASFVGGWFTADQLAALVGRSPLQVLLALQRAADQGMRVDEDGDRLRLRVVSTRPVLKSLASAWTRGEEPAPEAAGPAPDAAEPVPRAAEPEPTRRASPPPGPPADPLAAAALAAEEARRAYAMGDADAALTRAAAALADIASDASDPARRLRIGLLSDCAIYLAQGSDPLSLQRALATASRAVEMLAEGDPPELSAAARISLATVATEEGSEASLDAAIDAFTAASRELSNAGRGVDAARLLNELAEVWMRRGDPVRATHLLRSSRQAFEAHAHTDPAAAYELASTEHVLARLAFHAVARPDAGRALWEAAAQHATAAVRGFEALGRTREEGRAWETLARVQTALGDAQAALESLHRAEARNREAHDRVGRARTANARSGLLAALGRPLDALAHLEESLALNLDVGSSAGVLHCARAFEAIRPGLPDRPDVRARVAALERRFAELADLFHRMQP